MSIELALLGGFANAIRGGQWREWFNVPEGQLRWISSDALNAIMYAIAVYIATGDVYVSLASAPLMWLGATIGWGDYIGALGGWRHDDLKENRFIDTLITHLKFSPQAWGCAGLAIRGIFWGACLSLPFFWLGQIVTAVSFISMGALMPLAYWLAIQWANRRAGDKWQSAGWALGEIFFGIILWSNL